MADRQMLRRLYSIGQSLTVALRLGNHQADRPSVRFLAKTGSFKVLVHENK
jgi:hypothetical protein